MTAPLENTWTTRELPILRSALRRLDAGEDFPNLEEIRAEVGLDVTQMRAALKALENAWPPYIEVIHAGMGANLVGGYVNAVSERTRRELGTWPSAEAVVDRLAAALAEAADVEEEPPRKGRLRAAAEAFLGFGRDISARSPSLAIRDHRKSRWPTLRFSHAED